MKNLLAESGHGGSGKGTPESITGWGWILEDNNGFEGGGVQPWKYIDVDNGGGRWNYETRGGRLRY